MLVIKEASLAVIISKERMLNALEVIGGTLGMPHFKPENNSFFSGLKIGIPSSAR